MAEGAADTGEDLTHEEKLEFARAVLAFVREHAEELRAKGLPVDEMIRTMEEKIAAVLEAEADMKAAQAADEHLTQKRVEMRKDVDRLTMHLPPELTDGMSTTEYLYQMALREGGRARKALGN